MQSNTIQMLALLVIFMVSALVLITAIPTFIKILKEVGYVDAGLIVFFVLAAALALFEIVSKLVL